MSKLYKKDMLEILEMLEISEPDWIASDQRQVEVLVGQIREKLIEALTPPPPPPEPVYSALPTPGPVIDGNLRLTVPGASALQSLWEYVVVEDGDGEFVGYATTHDGETYFDLTHDITEGGSYTFKVKYTPDEGVTLAPSAYGTTTVTAYSVTHDFTDCVEGTQRTAALAGKDYVGEVLVNPVNFTLPSSISVEVDGVALTEGLTYSSTTGAYTVAGAKVTGALKVTAIADGV